MLMDMYLKPCFVEVPECSANQQQDFTESYKPRITEEATIYKTTKRELKEFEKQVNAAAVELCLNNVRLLSRRGELLEMARKKVADEGYVFKKGRSPSKVYGESATEEPAVTPKRPKYDKEMRDERLKVIGEELRDISRILLFKEKRLSQAEAARNYRLCEQLTEEMMDLKSKKREPDAEKRLFEKKRRAKKRQARIQNESESSDIDGGPSSSRSRSSTCSRSVTPVSSQLLSPTIPRSSSVCSAKSPEHAEVQQIVSQESSCLLSPSCHGSRINPIKCESHSDFNPLSPLMSSDPESPAGTDSHF